jgi:RND family efflux transporter MFP subunit
MLAQFYSLSLWKRVGEAKYRLAICLILLLPNISHAQTTLDATLHWAKRAELSTPLSGLVTDVLARDGEAVKQGQLLLRLDPRPYNNQKQAAQARLQRAAAQLQEARREMERVQSLYDQVLIASRELEVTKTALLAAEAEQADAKAALNQANLDLEYAQLRAPFKGRIVAKQVEVGEIISNQCQVKPLFILADTESLIARAWMNAEHAAAVQLGQNATVQHGGQNYAGQVTHIGWEANEETGLLAVDVRLQVPLRAGLKAVVVLE